MTFKGYPCATMNILAEMPSASNSDTQHQHENSDLPKGRLDSVVEIYFSSIVRECWKDIHFATMLPDITDMTVKSHNAKL